MTDDPAERLWQLARAAMERKRYDLAEPPLRDLLAAAPDDPRAARALAWSVYQQQRYDDAEPLARRAVAADPNDAWGRELLARVLWALHDEAGSLAEAEASVVLDPRRAQAYSV